VSQPTVRQPETYALPVESSVRFALDGLAKHTIRYVVGPLR